MEGYEMKNTQLMYPEVINKDALLKLIKEKAMPLLNVREEDHEVWDNGFGTGKVEHKYYIYDNEENERIELTKEEFAVFKWFTEANE